MLSNKYEKSMIININITKRFYVIDNRSHHKTRVADLE